MAQNSEHHAPDPDQDEDSVSRWTVTTITWIAALALAGILALIILLGLVLAVLGDPQEMAARVQLVRDIFILVVTLELLIIVVALGVFVFQIARLVNLLQSEIKPILDGAYDTVRITKETARFVSVNITAPIVRLISFLAGLRVFIREIAGIRRAIRPHTRKRAASQEK